jgi:hypothetical protein
MWGLKTLGAGPNSCRAADANPRFARRNEPSPGRGERMVQSAPCDFQPHETRRVPTQRATRLPLVTKRVLRSDTPTPGAPKESTFPLVTRKIPLHRQCRSTTGQALVDHKIVAAKQQHSVTTENGTANRIAIPLVTNEVPSRVASEKSYQEHQCPTTNDQRRTTNSYFPPNIPTTRSKSSIVL